ncbi:UPF0149 family protein [Alloalcanivorax sp. C16-1]|uniref:UPF0149 family protein n=1 Tax=Alloalcanivorax sp. C16-1 TaxID=3390051 RepID=UPI00397105CA
MSDLPDFERLAQAASAAGLATSPSELHGVICGLLATGHGQEDATLLGILSAHAEQPQGLGADLGGDLMEWRDAAREGFAGTGLELVLLLPGDEEELGLRVAALGQWAEGFLVGFGTGAAGINDSQLSPGVQEALSDLSAISQVSTPEDDDEEQEQLLEQVTEHCRVSALMIYTDLVMKPAAKPDQAPSKPTRH